MDFTTTVTALIVLLSADVVAFQTGITTMSPVETHMLRVKMVSDSYWNTCLSCMHSVHMIRARIWESN